MASNINIAAEFNKLGIEYTSQGVGRYKIRCPFHDDNTPSCDVFLDSARFKCYSCGEKGSVARIISRISGEPIHSVIARIQGEQDKPIDTAVITRNAKNIWSAQSLLEELYKRGVSDNTIRVYSLGEAEGRITIPIKNFEGKYVNIRKYKPGATGEPKFVNTRGRGKRNRIYPFDQLQYQKIILCGGEVKALAALERLNEHDIGAISFTGGEHAYLEGAEDYLIGKKVWVCLDIDSTGRKSSEHWCNKLSEGNLEWVGNIDLPLDKKKYPKGDLNDYVVEHTVEELLELLNTTPQWTRTVLKPQEKKLAEPIPLSLREATKAANAHKRFKTKVAVTAAQQDNYLLPHKFKVKCNKQQTNCYACPIYATKDEVDEPILTMPEENSAYAAMIDEPEAKLHGCIVDSLGIPACGDVKFEILSRISLREARIQRAFSISELDSDKVSIPALIVGSEIEFGSTYEITGQTLAHPKTQKSICILSHAEKVADDLESFKLTFPEELTRFRPHEWTVEGLDFTLDILYDEISRNITKIYQRKNLHVLIDLTYHSVIGFDYGQGLKKGWVESLVIGDSAQGKTDTALKMQKYYGLGDKMDCKNATTAGVIGGYEQINGKWFVQWGVIPLNDRGLVILEELKGMRGETFSRFTDMRTSGVAELPKIVRSRSSARTRLLALTNPKGTRGMSSYSYGVNAISDLIGQPEDIRRFDCCLILNRLDVPSDIVNQSLPETPSTITPEQCRKLILWAWTRLPEQIVFSDGTVEFARAAASRLCELFTESVPLIDRGDARNKILRLAAALAARTFSTDEAYEQVIIRPCHVAWVERFLMSEYSADKHGYREYSEQERKNETIKGNTEVIGALTTMPNTGVIAERLLHLDEFTIQDFMDWTGLTQDECQFHIGKLVRLNAIKRKDRGYVKTGTFNTLLKDYKPNIPEHVEVERARFE